MKDRIAQIRKELGLSQSKFAESLNLSRNFIGLVESGDRNISDRTVLDICREFNVNKHWLETGEGEMFLPQSADQELAKIVATIVSGDEELKEFRTELIKLLVEMDDETMKKFMEHICNLADMYRKTKK